MPKLRIGDRVYGKTKQLAGKSGVVCRVLKESRQFKYEVDWSTGETEIVAARSIVLQEEDSRHVGSATSFVELLTAEYTTVSFEDSSSCGSGSDDAAGSGDEDAAAAHCNPDNDGEVVVHGRLWKPCESVLLDPACYAPPRRTTFLWPPVLQIGERSVVQYFYLMYPMTTVRDTILHMTSNLIAGSHRDLDEGDLFRWIGIRLAMAVEPRRGPTTVYWDTDTKEGCVGTAANFGGRFHMSRHRFQQIMSALSFTSDTTVDDPWIPIKSIVDGFNAQREKCVSPVNLLCVDECMSAWKGREGKYTHDGLPHKTKIARKPEGLGTELKSLADGDSGVLLRLELVEGSVRQHQKQYHAQFGEGTAVVLRLLEKYKGTGRTVVADSAFASVKTLIQLEKLHGLYFMGIVKTATKQYPKKFLTDWIATSPAPGDFKVMESTTDIGKKMYALCWADKKTKMIISNRGTTLPGSDSVRQRHRIVVDNGKRRPCATKRESLVHK